MQGRAALTSNPARRMLSGMPRAVRLFLVLALLLAPILHPTALAAPGPAVGSVQHYSGNDDGDGDHGGSGLLHGFGVPASCVGAGACDLQTILTSDAPAGRTATLIHDVRLDALIGLDISPDPSPPRVSF
ncbi:MAG: hypothetical protein A3G73_00665 [Rhodospirillales bacterium RIFCSPLOWO2_12_FULL_67_15]|nr:MAG: hypothetical protein A3G73_00665 [Rhodospirillales bacterium RIFCSPLOWO2_12_FULL_67_15]